MAKDLIKRLFGERPSEGGKRPSASEQRAVVPASPTWEKSVPRDSQPRTTERRPQDSETYWDGLRTRLQAQARQEASLLAANFSVVFQQGESRYISGTQMTLTAAQLREQYPNVAQNLVAWFYQFLTVELLDIEGYKSRYSDTYVTDPRLMLLSVKNAYSAIEGLTYQQYMGGTWGSNGTWNACTIMCPGQGMLSLTKLKQDRYIEPIEYYAKLLENSYAALGMESRKFLQVPTWYANTI